MRRTKRLVFWSVIGILVVILAGAVVRASGSGLGCPHWPACFEESFFPPLSEAGIPAAYRDSEHVNLQKTWTEWINRLIGMIAGLVILAAAISAWLESTRGRRGVAILVTSAGVITAFQGWLGALVVKYELDPRFVTVHLLFALLILFMLIQAWLMLRETPGGFEHEEPRARALRLARWMLGLGLFQFLLGALLRGTLDLIAEEQPGLARGAWIDEAGLVDWLHRGLAFALMGGVILSGLGIRALGAPDRLLPGTARAATLLVLAQVVFGLILIEWDLRPAIQVAHILLGSLLAAALFLQERLLARS